jgi:urease accessory protein
MLYQADPMILMPGADIANSLRLTVPEDAVALCCDAYGFHDPAGGGARFARLETRTTLHRPDGSLLVSDRGVIRGEEIGTSASPLGPFRAFGTVLLIHGDWTDRARIITAVEESGCVAGASALPNDTGVALRLLAAETGMLARGLATACAAGFEAMFGHLPQPRRK